MKKLIGLLLLLPMAVLAQQPFINSISPTNIEVGQLVTISGSNLTNISEVYFGGVKVSGADVTVLSDNLVTAVVPAGATHGYLTALDGTNNLIAQSPTQFFISFVGSDITSFDDDADEYTLSTAENAASDICLCDVNGDDKNDVIIVHNVQTSDDSENEISIFINNKTGTGAADFSAVTNLNISINQTGFNSVTCNDFDNDGNPDLAFSSNKGTNTRDIYILRNPGSGNFASTPTQSINLPNTSAEGQRVPRFIRSADMDRDGLIDIVVGNDTDNVLHVIRNTSSGPGNISFTIDESNGYGTRTETSGVIALADVNGDGTIDIISAPFRRSSGQGSAINILENNSNSGNLRFSDPVTITGVTEISDIAAGDLNGDGLPDLVVARRNDGFVTVFQNVSTSGNTSFGTASNIISGGSAFGVDLGDLNGDGLLDIAASYANGNIHVFENASSGNVSFTNEQTLLTGSTTQYICIGDVNNDAKPDLVYTQNIQLADVGNLGVIINRNCVEPVISPSNDTFCQDDNYTLVATSIAAGSGTYLWSIPTGNGTVNDSDNTDPEVIINISSGSNATVRVVVDQDGCITQSEVDFTIINGFSKPTSPTFVAGSNDLICVGEDYNIQVTGAVPYEEFEWTKPNGQIEVITPSSPTAASSLPINNASLTDAGLYTVRARESSGCYSDASIEFELYVSQPPLFQITNSGGDNFCATGNVTLSVPDFSSDYDYQWERNGTPITGATNFNYDANQTGNYSVVLTDKTDNCTNETETYSITAISEPVSDITGSQNVCADVETTFIASSTGQSGFDLEYSWTVDGSPVSPAMPTELPVTFSTGAHTVTLTTQYNASEVAACSDEVTLNITVSDPPTLVFDQTDGTEKCLAESLPIFVTNSGIDNYSWAIRNAAASNDTIINANAGTSSGVDLSTPLNVDSVYAVVTVQTTTGCTVKDSVLIKNFPTDVDISATGFDTSTDIITLEDENYVVLEAINFTTITGWVAVDEGTNTELDIIDNPTANSVTVFPSQPATLVTITGTDDNGCTVGSQIEILLDNLRPKKTFSPNGDGINDCWEILNSSQAETAGCKIYVFDARGRNIFVGDAPFTDNCVWDGNFNGTPVPEGIYYFVFKCSDDAMSKTGSILLAK
ncbi:MAG: hypothetical protein Tsb0034_23620 [Ekhidna sp.]